MPYWLEIETLINFSLVAPTCLLRSTHMCMGQWPGAGAQQEEVGSSRGCLRVRSVKSIAPLCFWEASV